MIKGLQINFRNCSHLYKNDHVLSILLRNEVQASKKDIRLLSMFQLCPNLDSSDPNTFY